MTTPDMNTYATEAQERWGHTDAYRTSQERTKKYTKADWERIKEESTAITVDLVAHIGEDPSTPPVQQIVARHYQSLRNYYEPTTELYRGLAQLYIEDHRFRAHYEAFHPDLPQFLHDAMLEYCVQHESLSK